MTEAINFLITPGEGGVGVSVLVNIGRDIKLDGGSILATGVAARASKQEHMRPLCAGGS